MRKGLVLALLMLAAFVAAQALAAKSHAASDGGRWGMGPSGGMMGNRDFVRHRYAWRNGIPAPYRSAINPFSPTPEARAAGRAVYADNCAICHGPSGLGDGEGGRDLNPPPPRLVGGQARRLYTDAFLLWTLSAGGEALGTDMPAFGDVLSKDEMWQVILFIQAGLPHR